MTPSKMSLAPGTVERMDELLAAGGLGDRERERVVCIRLLALGRTGSDVAEVIGRSEDTVYRHKARFLRAGEQALRTGRWGGRRNQVLSLEAEREFVAGFREAAERGELITANDMVAALADQTGRRVDATTMYRMLERHGWRKVMPRPTHPDGDPERRAAFKETSRS